MIALYLASPAWGLEKVALQLKWQHQFQFAGYYAAVEQGYYRDAGLEVELREAGPDTDVIHEVVSGRAQFGVGTADLVLARAAGQPVVALAVILQHSALVLLTPADGGRTVQDLAGKRIMIHRGEAELVAYLQEEGVRAGSYRLLPHSFNPLDLVKGKADAMSAYSFNEPFVLRQAGFPYAILSPRSAGIDFYGDNLFTSERLLSRNSALVAAFRAASLRGWRYAMAHPDEVADLILAKYSTRYSRAHLRFEAAEMERLMQPILVEIGHMNPGRWRYIADVYASLDLVPSNMPLDGLVYDPNPPKLPPWAHTAIFLGTLFFVLVLAVAWRFAYFNRALNAEIVARKAAEGEAKASEARALEANAQLRQRLEEVAKLQAALKEQAIRDSLTGLYNRRYLDETLERELARAGRERHGLGLVMIDLDHFKRLNDTYGHQVGDDALRAVADLLHHHMRHEDVPCRYGGEEILVLLPHMPLAVAAQRAETWRRGIEDIRLEAEGKEVRITASLGVAAYPEHGRAPADLSRNADLALYAAKEGGRNRVVVYQPKLASSEPGVASSS